MRSRHNKDCGRSGLAGPPTNPYCGCSLLRSSLGTHARLCDTYDNSDRLTRNICSNISAGTWIATTCPLRGNTSSTRRVSCILLTCLSLLSCQSSAEEDKAAASVPLTRFVDEAGRTNVPGANKNFKVAALLVCVALLLPWGAAHMVAAPLPEFRPVLGSKLQAGSPFCTFPGVEMGNYESERPTVIRRQLPAAVSPGEEHASARKSSSGRFVVKPSAAYTMTNLASGFSLTGFAIPL